MFLLRRRPLYSSERFARGKRHAVYFLIGALFLLLIGGWLFSWASYRDEVTIASIRVFGVDTFPAEDIRAFAEEKLTGAYFRFWSRANSFLYPKKAIAEGLFTAFPRLAHVSVSRTGLREISIRVEERAPSYLWCGETRPAEAGRTPCYFLDPQGIAFTRAPYFSGGVYFEIYGPFTGPRTPPAAFHEAPIGRSFFPTGEWRRVIIFKDALITAGLSPDTLVVETSGEASFLFPSGLRMVFSLTQDLDEALENLFAAVGTAPLMKEAFTLPEKNPFSYVDVRFKNRIFYK